MSQGAPPSADRGSETRTPPPTAELNVRPPVWFCRWMLAPIRIADPAWWQSNPQDSYRRLLDLPGLWRDEGSGFWLAARHADVLAVERDPFTFASRANDVGFYRFEPSPFEATMISNNDPVHLEQRRMINRRFTPNAVRGHADHYESVVRELVDAAIEEQVATGSVEVVDALAAQLPCRITAELIGFGAERWREVKSWSERQMRIDQRSVDATVFAELHSSIEEWAGVMQELLPQRGADPADDLFSAWLAEGMDPMTMVQETGLMIAGGAETTRTVIAHGLRAFADHPAQWEYLAEDIGRAGLAVEELIRWVTPLNNMFRIATTDTEVAGTTIRSGERVALVYPAANRDPRVFDEPDVFDVTRDPNPHVAFGHGTHFCLGANIARQGLRLLFEELIGRVANLRVVSEPDIEPNIFARAVRRFDLAFDLR